MVLRRSTTRMAEQINQNCLEECVNKILSDNPVVKKNSDVFCQYLVFDCVKCDGYNGLCVDYLPVKKFPV